jgi:hypothetical protein
VFVLYICEFSFFLSNTTKTSKEADMSRRNRVRLNGDYISNSTLNIPNYEATPNTNIINIIREDSYIIYTTFFNQDNSQKIEI